MPVSWKRAIIEVLKGASNSLILIAITGGAQTLLSLLVWQMLFGSEPLGFSMGLTLVGFAGWFLSLLMGFGGRRSAAAPSGPTPFPSVLSNRTALQQLGSQSDRAGCGCLIFVASLIPLAIAFAIRVQADMSTGKSWQDIFPPLP
ncbi:MAG: hypothetical protein JXA89_09835 [Anaerolineae bacterium]|nr:hypothetical protein [Anaerolineae bacterium]